MPKTLLAVDDSATMRKILEITFSGEDFNVVAAEGRGAALEKLGPDTQAAVVDTSLGSDDGYALAKEIRSRNPNTALVLLSSKHNPYDAAKGKDAGADDYADKPFDTQQLIDKVQKALTARASGAAAGTGTQAYGAAGAGGPPSSPQPHAQQPMASSSKSVASAGGPASRGGDRSKTLMFDTGVAPPPNAPQEVKPAAGRPAEAAKPAAEAAKPAAAHTPAAHPPAQTGARVTQEAQKVSASVNGQLAGKLAELGLSPAQADAVMALSREVVERVVWEVVPQLAEAIIKEEIVRLTKD